MSEKEDKEVLIGKLIRKRKAENDAFQKLLTAIESRPAPAVKPKNTEATKN